MEIDKDISPKANIFRTKHIKVEKRAYNTKMTPNSYFDYVYSYPSQIGIRWHNLDSLGGYVSIKESNPSGKDAEFLEKKFVKQEFYSHDYLKALTEKRNSTKFFKNGTVSLQNSLSNIPVYIVLNGRGEIVLSKPSKVQAPTNLSNQVNSKIYDLIGAPDPNIEKKSGLGLFFFDQMDGEKYLKEVAKSDFAGTHTVGLSLHKISLDAAYRVTREFHPGIDFRYVPNFSQVKKLLLTGVNKADMIIDKKQQICFNPNKWNTLSAVLKLNNSFQTPVALTNTLNQGTTPYFKGVPIYIVTVKDTPSQLWLEKFFTAPPKLENQINPNVTNVSKISGSSHNATFLNKEEINSYNYIFFDKEQAINFSKKNISKKPKYLKLLNSGRKTKILIYNLEDFLEDWEDSEVEKQIMSNEEKGALITSKYNFFMTPKANDGILEPEPKHLQQTYALKIGQSLGIKFRILKRTVGALFNI